MRHGLSGAAFIFAKMKISQINGGKDHDRDTEKRCKGRKTRPADPLAEGQGPDHPCLPGRIPDGPGPGGGHHPGGHGPHRQSGHRGLREAGHGAIQVLQPEIPPGGHGGGCQRREGGQRELLHDRWALLRGVGGADRLHRQVRESVRGQHAPGRRVQAPHLPLRLPGDAGRRHRAAEDRPEGDGPAHRDGNHGREAPATV